MTEIVSRVNAKARGLKRYFTGKPCKHGHIAQRKTINGGCIPCGLIIERRRHHANPEKRAAKNKKWEAANLERRNELKRRWRIENIEKVRERDRERSRRRLLTDPERAHEYGRRHRASEHGRRMAVLKQARRRAIKRTAAGSFSVDDERRLRQRQKKCHICGKRFNKRDPATLDHVIALAVGGAHDASNISLAHRSCNELKQARRTHLI